MPTSMFDLLTKEFLEEQYITLGKSTSKIAEENNCDYQTIRKYCRKYGIKRIYRKKEKLAYLIGLKFTDWEVICIDGIDKNNKTLLKCQCRLCGRIRHLLPGEIKHKAYHSCQCKVLEKRKNTWVGRIHSTYWKTIARNAIRRGLDFDITREEAWVLVEKQNNKCALSGVEFIWPQSSYEFDHERVMTASIDRIDPKKSYTIDNVQWVHKDVNWMKQDLTEEKFIDYCIKIAAVEHAKRSQGNSIQAA